MLHSDWFSLIALVSTNVSITDIMQGDNGNIKVLIGIALLINYLVIYMTYQCVVVFCLYNEMALYNSITGHADLLLSGITPIHEIWIKTMHDFWFCVYLKFNTCLVCQK